MAARIALQRTILALYVLALGLLVTQPVRIAPGIVLGNMACLLALGCPLLVGS